jgi:hypothetical protein
MSRPLGLLLLAVFVVVPDQAMAVERVSSDVEIGVAAASYNDARIPGDTGTLFSLTDDLEADPAFAFRYQAAVRPGERHTLRALYAPLTLRSRKTADRPIDFYGETFAAGTDLEARFKFNSYRLTYRYSLWLGTNGEAALGVTGKIRDAAISLEGGGRFAERTDFGFVPLIHGLVRWRFSDPFGLLFEADALAAPQGRAEDLHLALEYTPVEALSLRGGYRMVEGGADNDQVYTFTWIHYGVVGATLRF